MFFRNFRGIITCIALLPSLSEAKVFVTLKEALTTAFPESQKCTIHTENKYLTEKQMKAARELSGYEIRSGLVVRYRANCQNTMERFAYTDTHRVRTHAETLFIILNSKQQIERVELLSFDEPLEYVPRDVWYGTFKGSVLNSDLELKRRIPNVTGASLTSQATLQAVRRTLALDQVLKGGK